MSSETEAFKAGVPSSLLTTPPQKHSSPWERDPSKHPSGGGLGGPAIHLLPGATDLLQVWSTVSELTVSPSNVAV